MTRRGRDEPPPGYTRERLGSVEIVALSGILEGVREAVREGSLYTYASARSIRRLHGRAPAYVAPLPGGGPPVVVRHAWHGGMLAPLTGDRFVGRTRAPHELAMSVRLAALDIPTPAIAAYVVYGAGSLLKRSDVATMFVERGTDLAEVLATNGDPARRARSVSAAAAVLAMMARAGVRHPDLNLKNILVTDGSDDRTQAFLLDIDRVTIEPARAVAASANAMRLVRSARKWRRRRGAPITDAEIATLEAAALGRAP